LILGGQWTQNAGSYGLAMGAIPSKRIPEVVDRLTSRYLSDRQGEETFQAFIQRIGKAECKKLLDDLAEVPSHDEAPDLYVDWADAREFTRGDMGVGECAGEVVSPVEFALAACEREVFEAQLSLEKRQLDQAVGGAYASMLHGAAALLRHRRLMVGDDPDTIVNEFRTHFYDTQVFFDPFARGQFAEHFFRAHERVGKNGHRGDGEFARQLVEEAQLFIEACHNCYGRMLAAAA
jgi:sulfite reductase (ferredoxin)